MRHSNEATTCWQVIYTKIMREADPEPGWCMSS